VVVALGCGTDSKITAQHDSAKLGPGGPEPPILAEMHEYVVVTEYYEASDRLVIRLYRDSLLVEDDVFTDPARIFNEAATFLHNFVDYSILEDVCVATGDCE
jgi:hypothetical protein